MLGNLRISYKLLMMIGVSILGILAVAAVGLSALWNNLLEDRKAQLQDVVLMARQALDLNYQASRQAGVSEAEALERSKALLRKLRYGKDDYFYAFNPQGLVVAHPNANVDGKNLYDAPDSDGVFFARKQMEAGINGGGFVYYRFPRATGGEPIPKLSYAVEFKTYGWVIGGGLYLDDIHAIFWDQARQMGIMAGLALMLVAALFWLLSRSIANPIVAMTLAMRRIADGDASTSIPALGRGDEVGAMADSGLYCHPDSSSCGVPLRIARSNPFAARGGAVWNCAYGRALVRGGPLPDAKRTPNVPARPSVRAGNR